ncbi:MAG: AMP-binding protein [Pseudomonadota bacterium]
MVDLKIPEDGATLDRLVDERRRRAFKRAKASPFFAGKLTHVNADRVTDPEEWAKIPILDKAQLRALSPQEFADDFCLPAPGAISEFWRSGGSTGKPLFYPRTREDIEWGRISMMRVYDCAGFAPGDVTHMALPLGIHPAGHMMARAGSALGLAMVWAGGGNTTPSPMQIELMQTFRPRGFVGMASYGLQLANLARGAGVDLSALGIDRLLCTAEPLSPSKRAKLTETFGATVRDCLGMTEVHMLGGEDSTGEGFRLWSDLCHAEVLDADTLLPVAEGEEGLLVVTALVSNAVTPFLRWNTGDVVTLRRGEAVGSRYDRFPYLKHAHRTAGFVKVRGINIGFTDFEDVMFREPTVADFRVDIAFDGAKDQLDLIVELAGGADAAATDAIAETVKRRFEVMPRISLAPAGTIARAFEGTVKPSRFADKR